MSKLIDFFNHIGKKHREHIQRMIRMDEFLNGQRESCAKIADISADMKYLKNTVDNINDKVNSLESDVNHINGRLEVIGNGTRMELFDTLYHWKKILCDRGWATEAEKREVEEIYRIYHDGLGGNGQGERYYNQIMALDEKEPEPESNN